MIDFIYRIFASLAMYSAISGSGAASNWNTYQPKEPAKIKELKK